MRSEAEKEEIRQFIKSTKWYQKIDFGDGLVTPGNYDSIGDLLNLGYDKINFKDKSFLDIGCNAGFYFNEAIKRGAKSAVGIDKSLPQVKKAILVSKYLGNSDKVDVFHSNIEADNSKVDDMSFDIVNFLCVFHHLNTPMFALKRIFKITKEVCIMEIRCMEEDDSRAWTKEIPHYTAPRTMFPTANLFKKVLLEEIGFKKVDVLGGNKTDLRIVFHCWK